MNMNTRIEQTIEFPFARSGLGIHYIPDIRSRKQYQASHPWARWAVLSPVGVCYALAADRPTAEAALNKLVNIKLG